ncbi:hypothetical protein D8674_010417 [Pyrus ussuriensis x Pyrus communis]|uniref:Uncharacterized protein n=1 Tax=Pyrus ussuriensis x Pyrus communis TaxID=2448454 RepID=A0A5N5FAN8_9ROSA|nr:hypothetical protein D8674_010417 [Pyrus ussuriensis x Pyrus communis]
MKDKGVANAAVLVGVERNEFHLQRVSRHGRVSFFGLEELLLCVDPFLNILLVDAIQIRNGELGAVLDNCIFSILLEPWKRS